MNNLIFLMNLLLTLSICPNNRNYYEDIKAENVYYSYIDENYEQNASSLYSYISTNGQNEYDHSKAYYIIELFFEEYYPDYNWRMTSKKITSDISGFIPINVQGDLFKSSIIKQKIDELYLRTSYGGCGPIAMMGILDYFARYLNYYEIANDYNMEEYLDKIAEDVLTHSLTFEIPFTNNTLNLSWDYVTAFNNLMKEYKLENTLKAKDNFKVFSGEHEDCWSDIVESINNGIPATLMTGLFSGKEDFAGHYSNIYGYETWVGYNPITGDIVEKRFIIARINQNKSEMPCYCDADILKDGNISVITYDMRFDNESNIYASDFAGSFVNDNGDGQYFFDNRYKTVLTANGDTLYTNRKRCSYIENKYLVMSPNRANAGEAYLFITFAHNVDKLVFNASLWSKNENIQNQIFEIQYFTDDCKWKTACVVDLTKLTHIKDVGDKFTVLFPKGTHQIRFYTKHFSPSGSRNKGRIVLDKIKIYYN